MGVGYSSKCGGRSDDFSVAKKRAPHKRQEETDDSEL
jgi:hypothetical protein